MVKKRTYIPDRGHLVWIDLNPTRGREQKKVRPAVVLSPRSYNKKTSLALMVPVTSKQKGYPFEVLLEAKNVSGMVLSDQVRTLDWRVRNVRYIEKINNATLESVQALVVALIKG